jgi:hypothetical protein
MSKDVSPWSNFNESPRLWYADCNREVPSRRARRPWPVMRGPLTCGPFISSVSSSFVAASSSPHYALQLVACCSHVEIFITTNTKARLRRRQCRIASRIIDHWIGIIFPGTPPGSPLAVGRDIDLVIRHDVAANFFLYEAESHPPVQTQQALASTSILCPSCSTSFQSQRTAMEPWTSESSEIYTIEMRLSACFQLPLF